MLRGRGTQGKSEASSIRGALMSELFGVTPLGQHGGKRPGAGRPRKGELREKRRPASDKLNSPTGSRYIIARLKRDANEGVKTAATLLEGIRDGLISPYAAGAE